jgi:hypothetical protein
MKIRHYGKLAKEWHAKSGDKFDFSVWGKDGDIEQCYCYEVEQDKRITHFLILDLDGNDGFFVGDERLIEQIKLLCPGINIDEIHPSTLSL